MFQSSCPVNFCSQMYLFPGHREKDVGMWVLFVDLKKNWYNTKHKVCETFTTKLKIFEI